MAVSLAYLTSECRPGSDHIRNRVQYYLSVALLVLIVSGVYGPVVTHDFSNWDDPKTIASVWKPGWQRAWKIVRDFDLGYTQTTYYSPMHFLSLMADQVLVSSEASAQAWVSKLMNVVFHGVNTVLVFALLSMLGAGRRGAFVGALVFAVHPLQVGTVAWITERKNLLAALFYLLGLLAFIRYYRGRGWKYAAPVIVSFVAGLLSKPAVVTLPVVLLGWMLVEPGGLAPRKPLYGLLAGLFVLSLGWGVFAVLTEVSHEGILPPLLHRPLLAAGALWFYLGKFVYPADLVVIYPKWDVVAHAQEFLGLFVSLVVVMGLLIYWRRRIDAMVLFGLWVFAINVLPVSGLVSFGHMSHSYVADHFAYLPLVGLALVVARGVEAMDVRLRGRETAGNVALVCIYGVVCVLSVLAIKQTWLWRDPASLWEATLEINKKSAAVYNNYGWVLMSRGDMDKAVEQFRKANELAPGLEAPYQNMGRIYHSVGDLESARRMFDKACSLNPWSNYPRIMLGKILREEGKHGESVEFLEECVKSNPRSAPLRMELALSYYATGRVSDALAELDRAVERDPLSPDSYAHKAMILLSQGDLDRTIVLLERSIALAPSAESHNMLGVAHARKGNLAAALDEFSRAYGLNPGLAGVRDNVANALLQLNRLAAARKFCHEEELLGRPCSEKVLQRLAGPSGTGN